MMFCSICGLANRGESGDNVCSIECLRTVYQGAAVAHMFYDKSTTEERKALRQYEEDMLLRQIDRGNPRSIGFSAGIIFRDREVRYGR